MSVLHDLRMESWTRSCGALAGGPHLRMGTVPAQSFPNERAQYYPHPYTRRAQKKDQIRLGLLAAKSSWVIVQLVWGAAVVVLGSGPARVGLRVLWYLLPGGGDSVVRQQLLRWSPRPPHGTVGRSNADAQARRRARCRQGTGRYPLLYQAPSQKKGPDRPQPNLL